MNLSENLRFYRLNGGYTQKELAELLKITETTYSRYELQKRAIPLESLVILADLYGISMDELIGRDFPK